MTEGNNTKLWIVGGLVAVILVVALGGNWFINKVTDRVILKLQKEYSPSPYGPGLDPDKVDPEMFRKGQTK